MPPARRIESHTRAVRSDSSSETVSAEPFSTASENSSISFL